MLKIKSIRKFFHRLFLCALILSTFNASLGCSLSEEELAELLKPLFDDITCGVFAELDHAKEAQDATLLFCQHHCTVEFESDAATLDEGDDDNDGLVNDCDPEPTIEDLDGDGILDGEDNCPRTFNPVQEYPEGEGFPEPGEACPFVKNEDKGIE